MIKVLVACADYPGENGRALQYVHVRNKYYQKNGIDVTVLNFACDKSYVYENIKVISLGDFYSDKMQFIDSVLICHAPNLRNHFRFIKKNNKIFKKMLFFFHGHEIVKFKEAYPKPYPFMQEKIIKRWIRDVYDYFKLKVWRNYFLKEDLKSLLIFVSNSLKNDFLKYLKLSEEEIMDRTYIINNCVGEIFEQENYNPKSDSNLYDFITIRSNLDSSVYCIDLVTEIANKNPDKSFLIIGNGKYFKYNIKPCNVTLINKSMQQEELITYINSSKIALMPTRRDSQGVMACELATFGIPLITSDLDVCREMFESWSNVYMCNEHDMLETINEKKFERSETKKSIFFHNNTIEKEVNLIKDN